GQNLSYSKHITKVEIVGAKSKGKYTLPTDKNHTGAWDASTLSAPATFTLSGVNVSTSEAVNNIIMGHNQDNYVFYMIPQMLTGVQVKVYFSDGSTPITATLTGQWKPGTTKTYALSQNTSTWLYELTATPPAPAAYNANATGNYKIESYREDPVSNTKQAVPWEVVGYDTNGDGTFSMTEPLPSWFTGLTAPNGNGSITTTGETGVANLVPEAASNKLAAMNAALKLNAKGNASDYYDLSTHDIKGNTTLRNTANCYVISHPGYYKIPLVYGNAIKNGGKNTNAYTYNGNPSDPNIAFVLENFKDHNNVDITDPWITQTYGGVNAPNGAKLVWADENGLVTNLAVTGSGTNAFVQFEVPAANIKNGNAVIAVTKDGVVVWSWHLWFTHDNALNTTACWNYQNKRYDFTEEALGMKYTAWIGTSYSSPRSIKVKVRQTKGQISPATRTEAILTITQNPGNVRQGFTTLYQEGRKDAFPGTDAGLVGTFNQNAGDNISIQNSIQHPENFYTYGLPWESFLPGSYSWFNLWSANNTTTYSFNDNPVVKTVYDPCPVGFKMPASNAFTGFTKTGDGTVTQADFNVFGAWNNGWEFNNKINAPDATVYFHASSARDEFTGSLFMGAGEGDYWAAVPFNNVEGINLMFQQGFIQSKQALHRAFGLSVRPVAEPKTRVTPKLPGSTEEDWSNNEDLDAGDIDI
ncbi:MAG: fimbrillin family protein, partial [Segatella oulorum]